MAYVEWERGTRRQVVNVDAHEAGITLRVECHGNGCDARSGIETTWELDQAVAIAESILSEIDQAALGRPNVRLALDALRQKA